MAKSTVLLAVVLTFCCNQAAGQDFRQQFMDLAAKNDTVGQKQLLEKWVAADSDDPELYVAGFNYFVNKSRKESITLGHNPQGDKVLQVMDTDTSKKEPVAFIYGDTYYDPRLLRKGFAYIAKGIAKNPARLDMRFGEIYMYGETGNYEKFTVGIIKTIEYSAVIDNKWHWTDNKAVENPKAFMFRAVQDYQVQLYNTGDNNLLKNMKRIAEAVLHHYPGHIESLSNISIVHLLQKAYDKALETLHQAETSAPEDAIILSNLAQAYKLKGDTASALKYYELTAKHGEERMRQFATGQIDALKRAQSTSVRD